MYEWKTYISLSLSLFLASIPFIGVYIDYRKMLITYKYEERKKFRQREIGNWTCDYVVWKWVREKESLGTIT